ncbi:MAG: DedA family protein [Actinomycetota bacterium]
MLERIVDFLRPLFDSWGYLIVGGATLLENSIGAGIIVPGETIVLVGAFFAAQGSLSPAWVAAAALIGGVAGDNLGYLIGRRAGRPFLDRHGGRFFLPEERLAKAERFYREHGGKTVFLSRFVPVVRAFGCLLAGASHMSYPRFFAYDFAGAVLWAGGHTAIGYVVGGQYERIERYLSGGGLIIFVVLVLLIVLGNRWRKRRQPEVQEEGASAPTKKP